MAAMCTHIHTSHVHVLSFLFTERSYSASLISAKSSSMTSTIVSRACRFFRGPWFRWRSPLHLLEFHRLPRCTASSRSETDERAKFSDIGHRGQIFLSPLLSVTFSFSIPACFVVLEISSWLDLNGTKKWNNESNGSLETIIASRDEG